MLPRGRCIEHNYLPAVTNGHAAYLDTRRRFEAAEHRSDVAKCAVGNLLADDLAERPDPDEYFATLTVQESAERLADALQLGGRALELERLGFALGDE